jgi:hypothetical protein
MRNLQKHKGQQIFGIRTSAVFANGTEYISFHSQIDR